MDIFVCIGSSCHLKGSYDIIALMKQAIADNGLEEKVTLKASFCLGYCIDGVTIKVGEQIVTGVSTQNFPQIFQKYVLEAL